MCSFCEDNYNKLGIFLKRDDYLYSRMKDLRNELQMQLFETKIVSEAIDAFFLHQYKKFDSLVGDCKCQVRVSMLLDFVQEDLSNSYDLKKIEEDMNELQERLMIFINKTEPNQMINIQKIIDKIQSSTFVDFFKKNKLNYEISHNVLLISIFFFTYLKVNRIEEISNSFISTTKAVKLQQIIKKKILFLTVQYEEQLAIKYGNKDIQKILKALEYKASCFMTAFYPSFVPVWNKIKNKKQLILKKTIFICDCGGIKDITSELFRSNANNVLELIKSHDLNEAAFVIEGYCFNGSFEQLSEKINLSMRNSIFDIPDLKLCSCQKSLNTPIIENIDEAILANFAQHAQFTNGVEIDWQGLELENSELKKEYDYLKTLSGYGIHDMSKFCIVHIYASTVGQELEDQRQLLLKLGKK